MKRLVQENAPEYSRAAEAEGFWCREQEALFSIRSKVDIITDILHTLMPTNEQSRYMIRGDDGIMWMAKTDFKPNEVRTMISSQLNYARKRWGDNPPPLPRRLLVNYTGNMQEGIDTETPPSCGSSFHASRAADATTVHSASTSEAEIWRRMYSGLPVTSIADISSVTSSERYLLKIRDDARMLQAEDALVATRNNNESPAKENESACISVGKNDAPKNNTKRVRSTTTLSNMSQHRRNEADAWLVLETRCQRSV